MREKLTFANVMSSVAVFLALGGTALAVKANSVGSRQIIDDSIKGRDVADGRLKGKDLKSGAIGAREVDEAAFDLEYFVKSGSDDGFCNPSSTAFVSCASVTLSPQEPSRALLVAGGGQHGTVGASGTCKFRAGGTDLVPNDGSVSIGDPETGRTALRTNGMGLTVTADVEPEVVEFELVCNETSGDVEFRTSFSALAIGGTAD